jgi:hypothetical protein
MICRTLSIWSLAWLVGTMVFGWTNTPAMIALGDTGSARDLPAAIATVGGTQNHMDSVMDAGNREEQSLRGTGVLVGRVTMGPISPVVRPGDAEAPAGVPDARIVISGLDGQEIASVVTDAAGGYRVRLSPGRYRIDMPTPPGVSFTKGLPATVTITEGQEARLDIRVDTGIR